MKQNNFRRTVLASAALLLAAHAGAQTAGDAQPAGQAAEPQAEQATVVVLGSRSAARTALDTAAPVGLINVKDMQTAGPLELGKLLQSLDPSFNFSSTFISDGTDIIRPATLRSLGPDQLLVLINGKRRHQQALVNVQQTVGRGSAGTDINAIPLSAIHHIEVLRDGAAAQYGSDAIAGVINIVLKSNVNETQVSGQVGTTSEGDGDMISGSVNRGWALGTDGGFINVSVEGRRRNETNRAGLDTARTDPPRVTQRIGDSDAKDAYLWANAALPAGRGGEFYAFGGASKRKGDSSGFFRAAGDDRTVPEVYPEGYLPNIRTTVKDASLAVGYRFDLPSEWKADVSVNHGRSELAFNEKNTINVSYWYEPRPTGGGIYGESPLAADTGTLKFNQTTFNADLKGPVAKGVFFATGFEWRRDGYEIEAGDPVSYQYGRTNNPAIQILTPAGTVAASGTQGFPGYTPSTAVDEGRHNIALYGDVEWRALDTLLLTGAVRYEKYSDFGNTTTGKVTARWDPSKQVGVRGSFSSGFRAPGVQQAFYSSVSTNLNAEGVLTETLTARQDSPVTRALGIAPLKEETSRNASFGLVLRPVPNFSLTADVYQIKIKDRIVFSSTIAPEAGGGPIANVLVPLKVGQAQFFTNAVDTKTRGIDIVAEHTSRWTGSTLVLSGQLGFNKTEVTGRHSTSSILTGEQLFDASQVTLIEHGQPRKHHVLSADYTMGKWNGNVRANYYGEVQGQGFTPGFIQTWEGKWIADMTLRYNFTKKLGLQLGVNNVFDTYPTEWDKTRAAPFPQLGFTHCWETCPFGINGRSMYVRADYAF
ncbi:TonB-dependent receptor plug domain-containing protein [Pseudoduganella umbonata]|uniref:Iron complex outermembrane receptor protein n=1 Tax=Pseudoduganella umbonata TaxID=864828 RepID=A0A4P8HSQ5_9BURK|nr:TonB-dependent receptor [Pseudoduganella umbonata]MBB3225310.1 iron complex outermembrane receptor protein [Pseudoduganella umbonata]QCP12903.1 TonB-dependent receptor [Pseudoduganella umbonata]